MFESEWRAWTGFFSESWLINCSDHLLSIFTSPFTSTTSWVSSQCFDLLFLLLFDVVSHHVTHTHTHNTWWRHNPLIAPLWLSIKEFLPRIFLLIYFLFIVIVCRLVLYLTVLWCRLFVFVSNSHKILWFLSLNWLLLLCMACWCLLEFV